MNNIKTSLVATTLIAALALTGCVATPELEPWAFGEPEPAVSSAGEETGETVDLSSLAAGDTISEELARDLNRDLKDGLRGYELPDGTFVLVKQNEPLPAAVKADAEADVNALPVSSGTSQEAQRTTISSGISASGTLSLNTGKRIVTLIFGTVSFADGTVTQGWLAAGAPKNADGGRPVGSSFDAVLAETQALIAAQSNPAEWEIIVQAR